ncbi:DNA ligase [Candidatus Woesearchaeota archaeon CG10_big_fil_rev_8_21_14_0_10_37_12]|nr:MAG: DNA ligase [Candidatus Woesearchaeota archaeon CG10_big_fil_rev_8_21_14_0_10_37_12]
MKYSSLVEVYEQLESTTKRLEKTHILSEFLKKASDLEHVLLLVQGKVFANWDERELGMAGRLIVKAISRSSGASSDKVEVIWKKTGDIGEAAEQLIGKKTQSTLFSQSLTAKKVFENLQKLAELEGAGTVDRKVQLVAELLTSANSKEAKYIVRTVIGELRVGLGEGTVRDAIVWAFFGKETGASYDEEKNDLVFTDSSREKYNTVVELVQESFDVMNDFGEIAILAKEKGKSGLETVSLSPGKPIKVMLYPKAKDFEDAFNRLGKPAAFEYKYDGFRLQIHRKKDKIALFTRSLDEVTKQFPEVVKFVEEYVKGDNFILDAEAVGFNPETKKYLPFQKVSQRIKRKYDIESMARQFPVEVNVFDVIEYGGESLLKEPFKERRKLLDKIIKDYPWKLKRADQIVTESAKKAESFFRESLASGNEGLMGKNLDGIYKPGSRVGYGVKIKEAMETLDVVIVGAEWGEGKRGDWLASFVVAVRDKDDFLEVGKVGTGIKEKDEEGVSFNQLTKMLKPFITKDSGKEVRVKPKIVIEVEYEEIQESPKYGSGFALRFPRFIRLREDRRAKDASTINDVNSLYDSQRGRKK